MDHSDFAKLIEESGLVFGTGRLRHLLTDGIISRWLHDNKWVVVTSIPCEWCKHLAKVGWDISEEKCMENLAHGGYCYRQILKDKFIPFLKNMLNGIYPPIEELQQKVHSGGTLESLVSIIHHELGTTYMKMCNVY